jgi:hypothetical protein
VDLIDEYVVADVYYTDGTPDSEWHQGSYFLKDELHGDEFFLAFESFRQRCVRRRVFRYSLWALTEELIAEYGVAPRELGITEEHIKRWLDGGVRAADIVQRVAVQWGLSPILGRAVGRGGHVTLS